MCGRKSFAIVSMRFMKCKSLFLSLFFWAALFAQHETDPSLAVTHGSPSSLVAGCVSAITGDLTFQDEDVVARGAQPISIPLSYLSAHSQSLFYGWSRIQHATARIGSKTFVEVADRNGARLFLSRMPDNSLKVLEGFGDVGYANKSGAKNLRYTTGYIKGRNMFLRFADGTERRYERVKMDDLFLLKEERLPSGHWLIFSMRRCGIITGIKSKSPDQTITWASVGFSDEGDSLRICTSSKEKVFTQFCRKHGQLCPVSVRSNVAPEINFTYARGRGPLKGRLTSRYFPEDRGQRFEYFKSGRVKTVFQRVGVKAVDTPIYEFSYDLERRWTNVTHVSGSIDRYHYSKDLRLLTHEHYDQDRQLIFRKTLTWGDGSSESEHRSYLKGVLVSDRSGKALRKTVYEHDAMGNVTREIVSSHNTEEASTSYEYEGALLRQVTYPSGLVKRLSYLEGTDLVTCELEGDGTRAWRRTFYVYNRHHLLISEITDDGVGTSIDDMEGVTRRLIKRITPKSTHPFYGLSEVIEHFAFDRVTGKEHLLKSERLVYNEIGLVAEKYLNGELMHTYEYDGQNRVILETDALGQATHFSYDVFGNVTREHREAAGLTRDVVYDCNANPISVSENGRKAEMVYDASFDHVATIDPMGQKTTYAYNTLGHRIRETSPLGIRSSKVVDPFGHVIKSHDRAGARRTALRNAFGLPLEEVDPLGHKRVFRYDTSGREVERVSPIGVVTQSTYDIFDRLTKKVILSQEGEVLAEESWDYDAFNLLTHVDAEGIATRYQYDIFGREVKRMRGQQITLTAYDEWDRPARITLFNGYNSRITLKTYDLLGRVIGERIESLDGDRLSEVEYTYDGAGRQTHVISQVDGQRACHEKRFDALGRLVWEKTPCGVETHTEYLESDHLEICTRDAKGTTLHKIYDFDGRLVREETLSIEGKLLEREVTEYDIGDRPIATTVDILVDGESVDIARREKSYDQCGHITTLKEGVGTAGERMTTYGYTPLGQKAWEEKENGCRITYTYHDLSPLKELRASDGSVHYLTTIDRLGRITHIDNIAAGTSTQRTYNPNGAVAYETLENGITIERDFDRIGRCKELRIDGLPPITYAYDPLSLRKVTMGAYCHTFDQYDLSGHPLKETLCNGTSLTKSYDLDGRLTHIVSPHFSQSVLGRDALGNITALRTLRGGADETTTYTYNALSQLLTEKGRTYAYDSTHNRIGDSGEEITFSTLGQNLAHTYNELGLLTQKGDLHFTYDALDRLIRIDRLDAPPLLFTYDSDHRMMTATCGDKTERFIYDGLNEIGALDDWNNLLNLRVLGNTPQAEIGATLLLVDPSGPTVPLNDIQGNIATLVPFSHAPPTHLTYTAFGEHATSSPTLTPYRFASKRFFPDADLVFFGRRFYDPSEGRFITPDPKGYDEGVNLYAYVLNNPLNSVDLYGLAREGKFWSSVHATKNVAGGVAIGLADCALDKALFAVDLGAFAGSFFSSNPNFYDDYKSRRNMLTNFTINQLNNLAGVDPSSRSFSYARNAAYWGASFATPISKIGRKGVQFATTIAKKRSVQHLAAQGVKGQIFNSGNKTARYMWGTQQKTTAVANRLNLYRPGADFLSGPNGMCIPTSKASLERLCIQSGFKEFPTHGPGRGFIINDRISIRIMNATSRHPNRAVFNPSPSSKTLINPFTGRHPRPPGNLVDKFDQREYIARLSHITLGP